MKAQWLGEWSSNLIGIRSRLRARITHLKEALIRVGFCIFKWISNTVTLKRWIRFKPRHECIPSRVEALKQTRRELLCAQNYFNSVSDHNLLDCAIYQMLAIESKYTYCLQKARSEASLTVAPPYQLKKS